MLVIITTLFCAAILSLQLLIGGTHPIFAIPGMLLIATAGVISAWPKLKIPSSVSITAFLSTLLFISYILIRNRLSPVEYIAREQFLIALGCLMVYLLFAFVITNQKFRLAIFIFLAILALFQVVIGAIQFKEQNQWMLIPWFVRTDDFWRASGLYISPNHFAGFLELIAILSFGAVFWSRFSIVGRILCAYVGAVCLAGIAISGSRGGYLSVAAGLVVLLILSLTVLGKLAPEKLLPLGLGAVGGVIAIFAVSIFFMSSSSFVKQRLDNLADAENVRFQLWDFALQQFQISPWVGTGGFTFLYYGRMFRPETLQNDPIHVHNDYLQLLAEYGIIGTVLFVIFLATHLIAGLATTKKLCDALRSDERIGSNQLWWTLSSISCVAAYMVHSTVDFNMQIPANAFLTSMFLGILAGGANLPRIQEPKAVSPAVGKVCLLLVSAFALVYFGRLLIPEYHAELARVALRDKKPEIAFVNAEKAIAGDPGNPNTHYYSGEAARTLALINNNNPDLSTYYQNKAIERLERGLQLFPYDSRIAFKLAHAYSQMGEYVDASMILDEVEEYDPNSHLLYAHRGLVELQGGYYEDAIEFFEKAQKLQAKEAYRLTDDFVSQGIALAKAGLEQENAEIQALEEAAQKLMSNLPEIETLPEETDESEPEAQPSPTPPLNLRDLDKFNFQQPTQLIFPLPQDQNQNPTTATSEPSPSKSPEPTPSLTPPNP